jgi:GrpB-like predicted nucleotidyltransferase (UPF0157 family)
LANLAVRIDHNGSTSVPGLAAKPVIDIQISVRCLQPMDAYRTPLIKLGYVHVPHEDDSFCPYFHKPAAWPHTHHVHVVESGGAEERRTLAFRDYLRTHAQVAREYEELKRKLARQVGGAGDAEREAYAEAKTDFIARITRRALAEGLPGELV